MPAYGTSAHHSPKTDTPNMAARPLSEQGRERQGQRGRIFLYFPSAHQTGEQKTCRAITLHVQ